MSQTDLFHMESTLDDPKKEIETDAIFLFQELERQLSECLLEQQVEEDSTDGPFSFIKNLANRTQEEFDENIAKDGEKNHFIRSLTKIFIILLKTKVVSLDKIN